MAYIPPHKRHSATGNSPSPASPPASFSRRFNQSLSLDGPSHPRGRRPPSHQRCGIMDIAYAAQSTSLWCIAGGCPHPDNFRLEPYPCDAVELREGYRPLVLSVAGDPPSVESEEEELPPWAAIVKGIERDLLSSLINAKSELAPRIKMSFVARIGKVFFRGEPSSCLESVRRAAYSGSDIRGKVSKFFNTSLQNEHIQEFEQLEMAKLGFGFDFDSQKERYIVKLLNKTLAGSVITCKCKVAEGGSLEIYKIEQNRLRHLVVDVSCVSKDLDLRLMLYSTEVSKTLDDVGKDGIKRLVSNAVIDPNVKGGLRWSLGKDSVDGTFSIIEVCHVKYKNFKSQNMRINFRYADRIHHKTSFGEVSNEVFFKFPGVSQQLRDENFEPSSVLAVIQDAVKLIWIHFLGKNVGVEGEKCKEK
ncbi:uncharacterized protein LOC141824986 isoform X2 [Curcuma longa]|uniref:uncharacterized protein LOC141824986 isoform X2 n=1 Tax=Curcuma longa TaxID=136217 RepID=UPI003D9EDA30